MRNKLFILFIMGIILFSFVSADYRFENTAGNELMRLYSNNGNLSVVGNISTGNYFIGSGKYLTDINVDEIDLSNYFTKSQVLGFGYYNLSSFNINDYYLKSNPYNFINSTNLAGAETDPKWTGNYSNVAFKNQANTFTQNNIFNQNLTVDTNTLFVNSNTDRVGIGTISPSEKLDVTGTSIFRGVMNLNSNKIINLANGTAAQDAATYSQLQAVSGAQGNYVPYTGATSNVNLGSYTLTTTGAISGGAITGTTINTGYGAKELGGAAVANGDTTNIPTGDQVYDFVIGQGYASGNEVQNLGVVTFNQAGTTTADFISKLEDLGAFDSYHSIMKASWSYAGNQDITDTGFGTLELAGSVIETWTDNADDTVRGNIHVRVTRPTTGAGNGQILVYNDQGPSYSPGWRQIWTSTTDGAGSGLDADLLDGLHATHFYNASNPAGYITSAQVGGAETDPKWTGNYSNVAFKNQANTFTSTQTFSGNVVLPTTGISGAGPNSGLNADLLDGLHATHFYNASNPAGYITAASLSGYGNVTGPASSTDNAIARYDGTTGKIIQNSAVTIDDSNANFRSDSVFSFLTSGGGAQTARFKSLQVSSSYSGTIPNDGILLGTDTNIYRSAANTLKTDDSLLVAGNVGIGTDSPGAKLDVAGDIRVPNNQFVVGTGYKKNINSQSIEQEVGRYYDVGQFYMHELAGFIEIKVTIDGSAVGQSYDYVFAPSYAFAEYAGSTVWHLLVPIRKFERSGNILDEFGIAVQWAGNHNFNVRIIKTEQGGSYATSTRDIKVVVRDPTGGYYAVTEQSGTGVMSIPTDYIYGGPHYNVNTGNVGIGTTTPTTAGLVVNKAVSGAGIDMSSNKIINLANGTAAQDAATYGQLQAVSGAQGNYVPYTGATSNVNLGARTLTTTGAITAGSFVGDGSGITGISGSQINNDLNWINSTQTVNNSDKLDGYDASYFMPLNKSVHGDFDFNGGWTSGGVSIIDGNLYAQSGYFYDINSLAVSTLEVNGSLVPPAGFDNTFDLGSASLRWRDGYFGRNVQVGGTLGVGTASPQGNLGIGSGSEISMQVAPSGSNYYGLRLKYGGADAFSLFHDDGDGTLNFGYHPTATNDISTHSKYLTVKKTGEVGVGVTNPSEKLEVAGSAKITGSMIIGQTNITTSANGDVNVW